MEANHYNDTYRERYRCILEDQSMDNNKKIELLLVGMCHIQETLGNSICDISSHMGALTAQCDVYKRKIKGLRDELARVKQSYNHREDEEERALDKRIESFGDNDILDDAIISHELDDILPPHDDNGNGNRREVYERISGRKGKERDEAEIVERDEPIMKKKKRKDKQYWDGEERPDEIMREDKVKETIGESKVSPIREERIEKKTKRKKETKEDHDGKNMHTYDGWNKPYQPIISIKPPSLEISKEFYPTNKTPTTAPNNPRATTYCNNNNNYVNSKSSKYFEL